MGYIRSTYDGYPLLILLQLLAGHQRLQWSMLIARTLFRAGQGRRLLYYVDYLLLEAIRTRVSSMHSAPIWMLIRPS